MPAKSEQNPDNNYYKGVPRPFEYRNSSNTRNDRDEGPAAKYEPEKYNPYEEPKYKDAYSEPKYKDAYSEPKYPQKNYEEESYKLMKERENQFAKYSEEVPREKTPKYSPEMEFSKENPQNEEKFPEYTDEIEKLKEELRRKEEELNNYQQSLNVKRAPETRESEEAMYTRINKVMFDKQKLEEQKKLNSMNLDYQISEKSKQRSREIMEKEREQAMRLEMLKRIREVEAKERYDKVMRAREYREQLEVQSQVKNTINYQERQQYRSDRPNEIPNETLAPSNNSLQSLNYSPGSQKFTKKTPKTMCFNPITGVLRDTSQYVLGSYPAYSVKDPSITYHKNLSKIPEMASHPAFQQHQFTKNHPKVVPSYPVTGNSPSANMYNPEWREEQEEKGNDKHMAEYGSIMMQNRNPTYG